MIKTIEIPLIPMGAVRSTHQGRFSKNTQRYHDYCNDIRLLVGSDRKLIESMLIEGNYHLTFVIPMSRSWSKKKKQEMLGKKHQQKPDIDNLYKGFVDSIFYPSSRGDCEISEISNVVKLWGNEGYILFDYYI